jgi:hypothetical protein
MDWIMGMLFLFGLLLAGSDGEWFPYPNLVGMGMFILVAAWSHRPQDAKI